MVLLRVHCRVWYYLMSSLKLDNGGEWNLSKFTDDPKLVEEALEARTLKRDDNWLEKWVEKNFMKSNKGKC